MSKITLNGVDYAGGSSGGSGGHTIINPSGQNMPSRTGLQFIGASVADDSVNNKTVVTITGGGVHYSTSEQVIGTWTNGKPLYRQVINFSTGNVASNIDFNIDSYMPANCVVVRSSHIIEFTYSGDTYHGVNWGGAYVNINGTHYFTFNIGSAVYNKDIELTIEYTKTTD
jgi:hypothetical protein